MNGLILSFFSLEIFSKTEGTDSEMESEFWKPEISAYGEVIIVY